MKYFQSSLVKIITKTFRQLFEQEKALIPEMNLNGVTGFFWHTFSIENFTNMFLQTWTILVLSTTPII